jgi:hypothetical protein
MMILRLRTISLIGCALIAMAACGGSDHRSPVEPSPSDSGSPGSPAPSVGGATVNGTVTTVSGAQVRALDAGLGGITISIAGTDLSTTTSPSGAFALHGVPPGLVRLQFQGAGASGTLDLNDVSQAEQISLSVVVNGSTIELAAQERVVGSQAQLEGKVVTVDYAARTLVVGTTTVVVPVEIPITNGNRDLELQDVIVGARIHVKGSRSGETITATSIMVQQTGLDRVTVTGEVSDVDGVCPDLTFKFGSLGVAVNGSTIFVQGTCGDLTGGATIEVKGLRRVDGSVLATMVKFKSNGNGPGDQTIEFSGVVSELTGSCPARSFNAGGHEVKTTGSTTFLTPCATLSNGQTVDVKGKTTGNGKVLASEVK